jgi:hypothetical protein
MPKTKISNKVPKTSSKGKTPVKSPVRGAKAPPPETAAERKARLLAEEKAKKRR